MPGHMTSADGWPSLAELLRAGAAHRPALAVLDRLAERLLKAGGGGGGADEDAVYSAMEALCRERAAAGEPGGAAHPRPASAGDEFVLKEKLGEGQYGAVYRAVWRGGDCAIKELHDAGYAEPGGEDGAGVGQARYKQAQELFIKEMAQLQALRHANILQYYDSIRRGDKVYLVTEYIPGGNLNGWLKKRRALGERVPLDALLKVAEDIGVGLNVMHCAGYLHCDIAARNVLKADVCKVADLGLARRLPPGGTAVPAKVFPTRWTSPEALAARAVDKANDVWAYGVFLWEVFTYCDGYPYPQLREDVSKCIKDGSAVIEQPRGCPDAVWAGVIAPCFAPAEARPSIDAALSAVRKLRHAFDSLLYFEAEAAPPPPLELPVPFPTDCVTFGALAELVGGALPSRVDAEFVYQQTPQCLDLGGLGVTDAGVAALVRAVPGLGFAALNLTRNAVTDAGCAALAAAAPPPRGAFASINLTGNPAITQAGVAALEESTVACRYQVSVTEFGHGTQVRESGRKVVGVAFRPPGADGRETTACYWAEDDKHVYIVDDIGDGDAAPFVREAAPSVHGALWAPDGGRFAAICADEHKYVRGPKKHPEVMIWESACSTEKPWVLEAPSGYLSVRFHPRNPDVVIFCHSGNEFQLFHAPTRTLASVVATLPHMVRRSVPHFVEVFSPPDAAGGRPDLLVWGSRSKVSVTLCPIDPGAGGFRADAAAAAEDWGPPVVISSPHRTATFDVKLQPKQQDLAIATCGGDGAAYLWDARGKRQVTFHKPGAKPVNAVEFTRDGDHLFLARGDLIYVHCAATGAKIHTFLAVHTGKIDDIAINASGTVLLSAGRDARVVRWPCAGAATVATQANPPPQLPGPRAAGRDSSYYSNYYSYGGTLEANSHAVPEDDGEEPWYEVPEADPPLAPSPPAPFLAAVNPSYAFYEAIYSD